ncbi:unnamed protein product [Urochloa humidicola]
MSGRAIQPRRALRHRPPSEFEGFRQDLRAVIHGNNTLGVHITLTMRLRFEIFRNGKAMPWKGRSCIELETGEAIITLFLLFNNLQKCHLASVQLHSRGSGFLEPATCSTKDSLFLGATGSLKLYSLFFYWCSNHDSQGCWTTK